MRSSLIYGTLSALIIIAFKLLVYFMHLQMTLTGILAGLGSIVLMFVPLFIAIRQRRENELGGYISLRQGMRVGLGISAVAGILYAAFTYLYFLYIDQETLTLVLERVKSQMIAAQSTPEQIQKELALQTDFYSPANQAIKGGLFSILGAGFVLSFICATFLVRKDPTEN